MDSLELNRLSGTLLTNTPLNTDSPEELNIRSISSSSLNVAPVLRDTTVSLNPVFEDALPPSGTVGTAISAVVGLNRNVTDTNSSIGIAITDIGTGSNGTWYFTTGGSTAWAPLGNVSQDNALLLTSNSRIYFQPSANYNGFIANAITFRAWDTTEGTNGSTANVTNNGGITAFSADTDTASLQVFAVNDAPVNTVPNSTSTTPIGFNEDTEFAFKDANAIQVRDIDAGDGAIEVRLSANSGTLFLANSINPN